MNKPLRLTVPLVALAMLASGCILAQSQESTGEGADPATVAPATATPAPTQEPASQSSVVTPMPAQDAGGAADANATTPAEPANATAEANATVGGNTTVDGNATAGPNATPPEPSAWPREGSFVSYNVSSLDMHRRGPVQSVGSNLDLVYRDGRWIGECTTERSRGESETRVSGLDMRSMTRASAGERSETVQLHPLMVKEQDGRAKAMVLRGCDPQVVTVQRHDVAPTDDLGAAWDAARSAKRSASGGEVRWDEDAGLVLSWVLPSRNSVVRGELAATDAPIEGLGGAPPAPPTT